MRLSPGGDFFLKYQEAEQGRPRLRGYLDGGGVPTAGWGSTGHGIKVGQDYSLDQVTAWFDDHVGMVEDALNSFGIPNLTQGQFDALVSFVYNIGVDAFRNSTMLKFLMQVKQDLAAMQFVRWKYDNGKVVNGLLERRKRERALFERG